MHKVVYIQSICGARLFSVRLANGKGTLTNDGAALEDGRINDEFAANAAGVLSMERLGENWQAAQKAVTDLVGKVGPEELESVLWGLQKKLAGKAATPEEIAAAVQECREEFNRKHGGAEGTLDSDTTLVETGKNELKTIGEVESSYAKATEDRSGMEGAGEGSHAETQSRGAPESAEATAELKQKSGVFNSALNVLKGIAQKAGSLKDKFYKSVNKQFGAEHSFDFGKPTGMLKGHLPDKPIHLKLKTLLRKRSEGYKNKHPFDFDEVADIVEQVHNPALLLKNEEGLEGVRAFFQVGSGRVFMVAIKPDGEINDISALFPKDFDKLVMTVKMLKGRSGDVLGIDTEKAIRMLESRSNTASALDPNDLSDAISVLKNLKGVNAAPVGNPETEPLYAAAEAAKGNKAVELKPIAGSDGTFTTLAFPDAKIKIDGEQKVIAVDGLTVDDFAGMKVTDAAALVASVEAKAAELGLDIGFYDDGVRAVWEGVKAKIKAEGAAAHERQQLAEKSGTVVDMLQKSFPDAKLHKTAEEWAAAQKKYGYELKDAEGEIYGFTDPETGDIYLNPDYFGTKQALEAPIHEYGHLGIIATKKVNKAVYDRGMKLANDFLDKPETAGDGAVRKIVDFILSDPVYSKQSREIQCEELLAQLIGKRGEEALRAETNQTVVGKIKSWLVEFWNTFGKALGLKEITPEQAEKMTVEEVADAIRAEMFSGRKYGEGLTVGKDNGKLSGVDQKRLTEVIRGLGSGELKHPRFTKEEAAASQGAEHERLWSYILSLESPDVHAGGGETRTSNDGADGSQGGSRLGCLGRMATRYGSDPRALVAESYKYLDSGAESKVYVSESGKGVIKVRSLNAIDIDGVKHELAKIVYHNSLFPKDAYTLRDIAVWNNKGHDEFYLILEQPLVTPKTDAKGNIVAPTEEQITRALQNTGKRFSIWDEAWDREDMDSDGDFSSADFATSARKIAFNGEFMVYDFKPGRNTFIDAETGEVRFIDPRVDINDPGAGFSVSKFGKRRINNDPVSFDGQPSGNGEGSKYGIGFKGVEFADGGARAVTKPVRVKRKLAGRRKAVNEFVKLMGGAEDPANTETDMLGLWVDNGGRLFDKLPFEIETSYSKGKSGVKKTRSSVADEFAESTAFYQDLDPAQRKVFFGTDKLEYGAIGEGLKNKLAEAGITRFTREDGTVDFEAVIDEFKRQWTNYERGEEVLKERNEWQEERDRAYVEEMERAEREAYDEISAEEAQARAEMEAADEASAAQIAADIAAGRFSRSGVRFSRRKMTALAKAKVGDSVEGVTADSLRNAIEKRIEDGLKENEYRFKKPGDRKRLVADAVKFYKRFSQKTVMLSDGRCVYFIPDTRAKSERGLSNDEAWAEYAIHAVTSSGGKLEGKNYNERLFNKTKAANIWRLENILKAERCEAQEATEGRDAGIAFYGRGVDGKTIKIITRLDEADNIYADLSEITVVNDRKKKELPPRKPPAEVVGAVRKGGDLLTDDTKSIPNSGAGAQGGRKLLFSRFAGEKGAENMGVGNANHARSMESAGADREKIWRETGWWKGKDGKWRFEMPNIRRGAWHGDPEERHFTGGGDDFYRYRLTELVDKDDFFKAYPQAKKIKVEFHKNMPTNVGGNFNEATLTIKLPQRCQIITDYAKYGLGEGKAAGLNAAGAKTMEHELQHAVQLFEDFAKGGSPSDPVRLYALDGNTGHALSVFAEAYGMDVTNDRHLAIIASNAQRIASDKTRGEMPKRLVEAFEAAAKEAGKTPAEFSDEINRLYDSHTDSPMGQYFKLAGEVEARNAQFRANMTPEERAATPPWATEDVPQERQLLFSRKGEDGKGTRGAELSDKKNLEGFRTYVKQIVPAPLPKRLESGSPRAALAWFEENMVGQTFSFDIPGYGHREFTPKPGHIGKLVCGGGKKADGTKIVKGRIAKANGNAALGMEMVRRGEISSADVEGWDSNRAKSLPLVPVVLREFDLGLHEVDPQGNDIIIFAKKFTNRRGRSNIIVMKLVGDSLMGPISSHMSDMTSAWLKNKDLLLTDKGEVYDGSANNSASRSPSRGDNAEGNSPKDNNSIANSAAGAQGGIRPSRAPAQVPPLPEVNLILVIVYPL